MRRLFPIPAFGLTALAALLLVSACAGTEYIEAPAPAPVVASTPPPVLVSPPPPPTPAPPAPVYEQTGVASWYGSDFQGRKTASGEVFDMYGLSAAHRTLPLGTVIHVTNLENSKSVVVTVNDRGPFVANRVLELSYGAARELGFVAQGTARVSIEATELPRSTSPFTVQAAVFSEEENANLLKDRLSFKYEHISIQPFVSNEGTFYRVRVGSYATEERAATVAAKLKLDGLEPFVVRKD
jgi:rare lipoprotein A